MTMDGEHTNDNRKRLSLWPVHKRFISKEAKERCIFISCICILILIAIAFSVAIGVMMSKGGHKSVNDFDNLMVINGHENGGIGDEISEIGGIGSDSMKTSVFSSELQEVSGSVHTLMCPIISQELENELLCGLDKKFSVSKLIYYSGDINMKNGFKIYVSCVDILVENMLKNVDTEYLFHGKCYTNVPGSTEEYLIHSVEIKESKDSFKYSLKSGNKEYYSIEMPPLNDSSYITYQLKEDWFLTTAHIHLFTSFFNTGKNDFCPKPNNLTSSVMNINFGQMKKTYHRKLDNPDNLKIDSDFGKLFGLKNPINSETLDLSKCMTSIWHDMTYINTMRAFSLEANAPVFPTAKDKSLSEAKFLPAPYDKMSNENIEKFMDYNQTRNKRFDINTNTMKVYNMIFPLINSYKV